MPQALQLLLTVLAGLARGRNEQDVADYLELAGELVTRGDSVRDELQELTAEIEELVRTGADPTPQQRQAVRDRRAALSAALRDPG